MTGYEVIGLHSSLHGYLSCDDCGEPIIRIEQGNGTTLACTRCGWSVYTSTGALREWEKSGRVSLPRPMKRLWAGPEGGE